MTRLRILVVLVALAAAACGASDEIRNEDPPPSTVSNRCGESGECEGSLGLYEAGLAAACTAYVGATTPGDWDLVDSCVVLVGAAPTGDRTDFLDRWLR
jgi:hypothetical protein